MINYLANFLTFLSFVFGFISIILSLESHFTLSSWAIIISVIFDGLDGQVARKNPQPSEFGKQIDSLVDVISFGVAPFVLGYIFVYGNFHPVSTLVLFVYLFCAVFRLAKYNLTPKEQMKDCFLGLPTTAGGGTLASFILIYRRCHTHSPPPVIFLLLVLILGILMVSSANYLNLDGIKKLFKRSLWPFIILVALISAILAGFYFITGKILPELIICALFFIYLLFSPFVVKFLHNH